MVLAHTSPRTCAPVHWQVYAEFLGQTFYSGLLSLFLELGIQRELCNLIQANTLHAANLRVCIYTILAYLISVVLHLYQVHFFFIKEDGQGPFVCY